MLILMNWQNYKYLIVIFKYENLLIKFKQLARIIKIILQAGIFAFRTYSTTPILTVYTVVSIWNIQSQFYQLFLKIQSQFSSPKMKHVHLQSHHGVQIKEFLTPRSKSKQKLYHSTAQMMDQQQINPLISYNLGSNLAQKGLATKQSLTPVRHSPRTPTRFQSSSVQKGEPYPQNSQNLHELFVTTNFQSDTKYCLNYINSIYFKDGKIYNLLQRTSAKKTYKCGCVRSNCEAKYCDCFKNGQVCGAQCGCRDCRNRKVRKNMGNNASTSTNSLNNGCKCRKSGCSKKYCECFQNGKKCGSHCQCIGCGNVE